MSEWPLSNYFKRLSDKKTTGRLHGSITYLQTRYSLRAWHLLSSQHVVWVDEYLLAVKAECGKTERQLGGNLKAIFSSITTCSLDGMGWEACQQAFIKIVEIMHYLL